MRSTLHIKFTIVYIIFGFLSIFVIATLTNGLTYSSLEKQTALKMYQNATVVSNDYLSKYFSDSISLRDARMQLEGMQGYFDASVWFVDTQGELITSASLDGTSAPASIENFNPLESGNERYQVGDYHGYFGENVITVITPVTKGFSTRGYLLIHKPVSVLRTSGFQMMRYVYITFLIIYVLSFGILLAVQMFIFRPLRKITYAATQYASGNLDHEIDVHTEDEMGYLSASLNYMSSQLKDMDNYQKKFIGNVSHDFRSPLTSIKGYVQAMADGTIPPEMQEKYLKIILFETERLTDLTSDLLSLNELDTKELLLSKTAFDIHEVIKNIAAAFEGICTSRRIRIELLFASKNLNVFADLSKIRRVLYNLLDNAIKFSEPESVITLETTERGGKIFISVKDHGDGIPKESLNKIWDRFYKSDASRGKDKRGTGLGLAIVKEILQAHGENISVVSTEGAGTEFTFSLPKA